MQISKQILGALQNGVNRENKIRNGGINQVGHNGNLIVLGKACLKDQWLNCCDSQ